MGNPHGGVAVDESEDVFERQFTLTAVSRGIRRYVEGELRDLPVGGSVQRQVDAAGRQIIVLRLRSSTAVVDEVQARLVGEGEREGRREQHWSFTVDHHRRTARNSIHSFVILPDLSHMVEKGPSDGAFEYESSDSQDQCKLPPLTGVNRSASETSSYGHEEPRRERDAAVNAVCESVRVASWQYEEVNKRVSEANKLLIEANHRLYAADKAVGKAKKLIAKVSKKLAKAVAAGQSDLVTLLEEEKANAVADRQWALEKFALAKRTFDLAEEFLKTALQSLRAAELALADTRAREVGGRQEKVYLPPLSPFNTK